LQCCSYKCRKISRTFFKFYLQYTLKTILLTNIKIPVPLAKHPATEKYEHRMKWTTTRRTTKYLTRHCFMEIVNICRSYSRIQAVVFNDIYRKMSISQQLLLTRTIVETYFSSIIGTCTHSRKYIITQTQFSKYFLATIIFEYIRHFKINYMVTY